MKKITQTNISKSIYFASFAPHKKQQGVVLITSLLVLGLLTTLSLTTLKMSGTQEKMSGNLKSISKAQFAAEQGISKGISRLVSGSITGNITYDETSVAWSSGPYTDSDGDANNNGVLDAGDEYLVSYSLKHQTVNVGGSEQFPVDLNDDRYFLISSTGTNGVASRSVDVVIGLTEGLTDENPYEVGLIGCDGVDFTSTGSSSSYSSSNNQTNNQNGDVSTTNVNAVMEFGSQSVVQGNAYSTGTLELKGDAIINGQGHANKMITLKSSNSMGAAFTELATITNQNTSNSNITDFNVNVLQDSVLVEIKECDPLDLDNNVFTSDIVAIKTTNNNGELSTSYYNSGSHKYTLGSSGSHHDIGVNGSTKKYYFTSLEHKGNGKNLTIKGDVIFYIEGGNLKLSGNGAELRLADNATLTIYLDGGVYEQTNSSTANAPGPGLSPARRGYPRDLNIYSNSTDLTLLTSSGEFRGIMYAPRSVIKLSSSAGIYGAVRGQLVNAVSSGAFIYDEDLGEYDPGINTGTPDFTGYKLVYWSE